MRTRVGNSWSFCYECCHGRVSSSSSLPTSVCTKKRKRFFLKRLVGRSRHTLTNTCVQRAGPVWNASQKDRASVVSEHARVRRRVHNDLKREWSRIIDDALEILPWQIPKYSVAYSCSHVLLFISCSCLLLLHSHFFRCSSSFFFFYITTRLVVRFTFLYTHSRPWNWPWHWRPSPVKPSTHIQV